MSKNRAAVLVVIKLIFGASLLFGTAEAPALHTPPNQGACQEDFACWQCDTMGNRICGGRL